MTLLDLSPAFYPILLAIVALYGAILSTINLIKDFRREKPRLEIVWGDEVIEENGEVIGFYGWIAARNIGIKAITLDYGYIKEHFELKQRFLNWFVKPSKKKYANNTEFCKIKTNNELSSGKSYTLEISEFDLDTAFGECYEGKLIAIFVDQIGNKYQSKPFSRRNFI